ncbi:MAG: hypothetical protein Q9M43_03965 [Sulfurimonas sp.]|nr:hypothetical protein [Sulfurimonas sp.]
MAQIDEIKESIGYLKVVFSIMIAINVSFIAWIYKNYNKFDLIDFILFLIISISITAGIIYVNRIILRKIRSLRNL